MCSDEKWFRSPHLERGGGGGSSPQSDQVLAYPSLLTSDRSLCVLFVEALGVSGVLPSAGDYHGLRCVDVGDGDVPGVSASPPEGGRKGEIVS